MSSIAIGGCIITVGQAFNLKLFSHSKERVQVLLCDIDFTIVDEVQNGCEIIVEYSPQVNVGVGMFVV